MGRRKVDYGFSIGDVVGSLTILEFCKVRRDQGARCYCSRYEVEGVVTLHGLRGGHTVSGKMFPGFRIPEDVQLDSEVVDVLRRAGTKWNLDPMGYVQGRVDGKQYKLHQFVMMYYGKDVPRGYEIDHINLNRKDNRIENLRLLDRFESNQHKQVKKNNSTGYPCLFFHSRYNRLAVLIRSRGEVHQKNFKLEEFDIAVEYCVVKHLELHGNLSQYWKAAWDSDPRVVAARELYSSGVNT